MLYKKYHRSYVSQFKKGAKIKLEVDKFKGEILSEPFIDEWRDIIIMIEFISNDKSLYWRQLTLVYDNGRLKENKDAIQEISQKSCKAV